jgi:signal transduction histidine kinase
VTAKNLERIFPGASELAQRMRALDWSKTDLSSPDRWPEHWRTAARLCLTSRIPVVMYWGAAFTVLYNDPYISFLGETKHPRFLGRPGRECWSEIWDTIGPMLQSVDATGEATWSEDLLMFFARRLPLEEVYARFTFGPLMAADGTVDGVFCPCTETTEQVVGARRLETLRKLGVKPAEARTVESACAHAAEMLAENGYDIPFAAIYLVDESGTTATFSASAGLRGDSHPLPQSATVAGAATSPWPLAAVLESHRPSDIADLGPVGMDLLGGPWQEPTRQAIVLPILGAAPGSLAGLLVVGVSTRRILDSAYRTFFDLIASHIGSAIVDARAYAEERKRAETLAELDRAKTAFFSNVSHEFRTPLTLLLGPIEDDLADSHEPLSSARRERLEMAHRNAMRLMRLVNMLLDFSRIEAGRVQAMYAPVDLATLSADLASVFRSAVERAGLKLIVQCPPLGEPVYVDREMWEKIVLNLLSNAFKFTLQGEIAVVVRRVGNMATLEVRDTGVGIPAPDVPHLFERFHRVRGAQGRTHEGGGIGLALVQELVKLHSGSVRVHSELRRGTTFTVAIPFGAAHLPTERIGATATATSATLNAAPYIEEALRWLPDEIAPDVMTSTIAPVGTPDARILLADDNADMRDYVRRLLAPHWTVEVVADGQAALEAVHARRPDLVLTDVMMPHLDGFGLLRALRADDATRSIPVILVSARAGEESRVEGLEAGADDYLVKPFSARELLARVNAHLQLSRSRLELIGREQAARVQAEDANRAKDEFLATLSHELRTPLNSILGWAVMLKSRQTDETFLPHALDVIERNARAQSQLVEDLLDVSRIITGKLRLDVRAVDLVGVINAAIDAVRPAATAKGIRLTAVLDPKAGPIAGDPDRVQQMLWNLLANAVKFTPKQGRVQVRLQKVNSHVEIVVTDTGCGIAADVLPRIFDRFHQADGTTTRRHGGLGLGLALVKHLIEMHGGVVRADSAGPDRGATFIVELPLMAQLTLEEASPAHAAPRRPPAVPSLVLDGLRLLVVDDDTDTLELFTRLFTRQGAEVLVAASTAEAVAELARRAPDVLLCDIEMPGEDGYALIRQVRTLSVKQGGTVPAIAVTAYGSVDDRIRLLSAGFQMHVAKPVDPDELVAVVASVAGRGRASGAD